METLPIFHGIKVGALLLVCITAFATESNASDLVIPQASHLEEDRHFWSNASMWPDEQLPEKGDIVVINSTQVIILDMDTPVLKLLHIKGILIFDDKDIELKAQDILITDGGTLQVGTEDEPFMFKATITLYGQLTTTELPVNATKAIVVLEGKLELHGKPIKRTWTTLANTVEAGDTKISLVDAVDDWHIGDSIVISATRYTESQSESSLVEIQDISVDKKNLTVKPCLNYSHLGVEETIIVNGEMVEVENRAAVGLLTRNIVIRGSSVDTTNEVIEEDPDGLNTDELTAQECTQVHCGGKGERDAFEAYIWIDRAARNSQDSFCRIMHVEMEHVGQAIGRFPINFHMNGNMSKSYVKGCSIHHTFYGAVNIFGSNNIVIEENVIYNANERGIVVEDGTGNILRHNLVLSVSSNTSLRNDDIPPAGVWVKSSENHVVKNWVADSQFGFWYRLSNKSESVSIDSSAVKQNWSFRENVAHSTLGGIALFAEDSQSNAFPVFENYLTCNYDLIIEISASEIILRDSHIGTGQTTITVMMEDSEIVDNNAIEIIASRGIFTNTIQCQIIARSRKIDLCPEIKASK